jgi:signal transduction histidine kinase
MSHEMRTPLHAVIGLTTLALDGAAGPLPPAAEGYLGGALTAAEALLGLITQARISPQLSSD